MLPVQAAHHGAQSLAPFTAVGQGHTLHTFLEILEQEAEDPSHRRINRLRKESRLPRARPRRLSNTTGCPLAFRQQLDQLAQDSCVDQGVNILAFGVPGIGKPLVLCAVGHRLVETDHPVLFVPTYRLVQELLANDRLPAPGRSGLPAQGVKESEVLFTLIAECYERSSLRIMSNLVFSERGAHLRQLHGHHRDH